MSAEPRTAAGKALLAREALNSRSFSLITAEAIVAIEDEATARADSGVDRLRLLRAFAESPIARTTWEDCRRNLDGIAYQYARLTEMERAS